MNKWILSGVFVLIFVVGVAVIFVNASVGVDDVFRSLNDMSPRVMSILALPIIAALFGLWMYWRKKSEERMWRVAMQKTRERSGEDSKAGKQ